jgi:hypothetical protein
LHFFWGDFVRPDKKKAAQRFFYFQITLKCLKNCGFDLGILPAISFPLIGGVCLVGVEWGLAMLKACGGWFFSEPFSLKSGG